MHLIDLGKYINILTDFGPCSSRRVNIWTEDIIIMDIIIVFVFIAALDKEACVISL